nr:DUF5009 domain-containing protein [Bacteroidota bacterium]
TLFPSFMFVSGIALVFSISNAIRKGMTKSGIMLKVSKRFLILIILGIIYNNRLSFDFANIRYVSVLSKIGFGYFVAAILLLYGTKSLRILIIAVILLGYWAAMTLIPVPGFGAGVLTPEGNLAGYIDRLLIPGSMYREFYDPEGIMVTISASVCTIAGSLTGMFLVNKKVTTGKKLLYLLATGILLILLGRLWNIIYPVNKEMWSGSFNLVVIGMTMIFFVFFYFLIDIKNFRKPALPLVVIGINAITIYMANRMINFSYTSEFVFNGFMHIAGAYASTVHALGILILEWLLLYYLYRRKIFLKV